jgi:hypothetical protein
MKSRPEGTPKIYLRNVSTSAWDMSREIGNDTTYTTCFRAKNGAPVGSLFIAAVLSHYTEDTFDKWFVILTAPPIPDGTKDTRRTGRPRKDGTVQPKQPQPAQAPATVTLPAPALVPAAELAPLTLASAKRRFKDGDTTVGLVDGTTTWPEEHYLYIAPALGEWAAAFFAGGAVAINYRFAERPEVAPLLEKLGVTPEDVPPNHMITKGSKS